MFRLPRKKDLKSNPIFACISTFVPIVFMTESRQFDPLTDVEDSAIILDNGEWPNFHDAEVHDLNIWRGDIRPDDNVWIGPVIKVTFELCALKEPYLVVLKFHDCNDIRLKEFNHQNAIYDLSFAFKDRGMNDRTGTPLTPAISVSFEEAFGVALTFECFRVQAIERIEPGNVRRS